MAKVRTGQVAVTMNDRIVVRLAGPDDEDFVQQDIPLYEETIRRKIESREVFIAELDGQPAGYARIEFLWSLLPYLALIRVLPGSRGQGIGQAMLAFIEGHLRGLGHNVLYSSSQVDESGPQFWHRHAGFEECGFIAGVNHGGIGEVFFRKEI